MNNFIKIWLIGGSIMMAWFFIGFNFIEEDKYVFLVFAVMLGITNYFVGRSQGYEEAKEEQLERDKKN